ncbi:MAG: type II secretion system F family protein, partial [Nitrospinota bacterium]
KIGEETGQLDRSLADVADHLQKIENLTAAIKKALMYPAFIIFSTFGALLFWLIFVMPKILALLQEMEVKLPLITIILMEISNFTQAYWYIFLLIPVAAFTLFQIVNKREAGRYYIDTMKLKIPVVEVIIYNKLLALFCEQMHILIAAGITIDKCFDIVADIIGNAVFQKAVSKSKNAISTGTAVSDALKAHKIFPQLIIRMVGIGEASGSLDDQFAFLGDHYMKKVDDISGKIDKMLEPIIIGVVGSIFAVMIIGLLIPIYDLISNIK